MLRFTSVTILGARVRYGEWRRKKYLFSSHHDGFLDWHCSFTGHLSCKKRNPLGPRVFCRHICWQKWKRQNHIVKSYQSAENSGRCISLHGLVIQRIEKHIALELDVFTDGKVILQKSDAHCSKWTIRESNIKPTFSHAVEQPHHPDPQVQPQWQVLEKKMKNYNKDNKDNNNGKLQQVITWCKKWQ